MILTCPQCATRYQADTAQFPAEGRKVRCAKCGQVWHQQAPAPEPEPWSELVGAERETTLAGPGADLAGQAPHSPFPALDAAGPVHRPRSAGERAAIAASLIGFAAIAILVVWAAIVYRQAVASVWPQASGIYKAVGIPVNAQGIAVADVTSHRDLSGGRPVLTISGVLINVTAKELAVPQVRVRLKDDEARELDHWDFSVGVSVLKPGQKIAFSTRRTNPPDGARHLEVSLSEAGR